MALMSRRWVLRLIVLLVASGFAFLARPLHHLVRVSWREEPAEPEAPEGTLNDASLMSRTPVGEVVTVRDLSDLKDALRRAKADDIAVAVAGERLSMGGQSLVADGIVLDMTGYNLVRYKPDREVAIAGGGATWADVLKTLDGVARSPAVAPCMADATVGGSLSVNAYGWQAGLPPVAAGVEELLVMLADGALWRCSRSENADLFGAVLGGYGLFAIIVEATLRTVPNVDCSFDSLLLDAADLPAALRRSAADDDVGFAVARLSVLPETLLQRAVLTEIRIDGGRPPSLRHWGQGWLHRSAKKGSVSDSYGKWLNWQLHSRVPSLLRPTGLSRNSVLNRTVGADMLTTPVTSTPLLTLLVPPDELPALLNQARLILAGYETELLEASVCLVGADEDTLLRYAAREVCALQLQFNDTRRPSGEYRVRELSMRLIERAIVLGGSMFMPYRRHASQLQITKAYGNLAGFHRLKRRFDPDERLQSNLYRAYFQQPLG